MIGAIIGDIVGSRFEFNNIRTKNFEFFCRECFYTDDTVMTLAIAKALADCRRNYKNLSKKAINNMRKFGRLYPNCDYGLRFKEWLFSDNPKPYNSCGNGAAMRVSDCGFIAKTLDEAKFLAREVTKVTHNHPEGLKGAEATAVAIFMAKQGSTIYEIKEYINKNYYSMNFKLEDIRENYGFNETCQNTVPQALEAFFESTSFEDAIRNAVSIGGDSDTLAAITGGVAEAYYGVPKNIKQQALTYLDNNLLKTLKEFEELY